MSDPLELVEKLIALSASSNEEEARNAAWKACDLIRKHSMSISMPSHAPKRQPVYASDLGSAAIMDAFAVAMNEARERRQREAYESLNEVFCSDLFDTPIHEANHLPVLVTARTTCKKCANVINMGAYAVLLKESFYHLRCAPKGKKKK